MAEEPDCYVDMIVGDDKFRFRLSGGPLSHPSSDPAVFEAYGFAAACWSRLEMHIGMILMHLNKPHQSTKEMNVYEPRWPSSIRDRIKAVRRYFKRHPALSAYKDIADKICGELLDHATTRNELLHAMIEGFTPETMSVTVNGMTTAPDGNTRIYKREIPLRSFGSLAGELNMLNEGLVIISRGIFTPEMIERLQMP